MCGSQFKTRKLQQIVKDCKFMKPTNVRDMWTWIETQICKERGRTEKKRNSNLKQSMSIICNSCKMLFIYLPSSCANLQHAEYASGRVFTIQLSWINQDRLLVYSVNLCTNSNFIYMH